MSGFQNALGHLPMGNGFGISVHRRAFGRFQGSEKTGDYFRRTHALRGVRHFVDYDRQIALQFTDRLLAFSFRYFQFHRLPAHRRINDQARGHPSG